MSHAQLFAFEADFVASLRCIPMAVRLKLDRSAIKLTLRQWSRFTRADRQVLLETPCATAPEIAAYRERLVALVALRSGEAAGPLAEPPLALWEMADRLPAVVPAFARSIGAPAPTAAAWRGLTELQRFALIKLTRDNHDNINFLPALREFGLATFASAYAVSSTGRSPRSMTARTTTPTMSKTPRQANRGP